MALLGLSILIASVSFLCYKHPPSTWTLLGLFRHQSSITTTKSKEVAPPPTASSAPVITTSILDETAPVVRKETPASIAKKKDEVRDRNAMPPPPSFKTTVLKPSSLTTPKITPPVPSFNLGDGNDDDEDPYASMPPPQFPAPNSAQRASNAPRAPSRLNAVKPSSSSLMAPPRGPLPNRGAPSSLAPPPTHSAVPTKPRKKVELTPGHSPLDWARLASSPTANLRGLPPTTPYLKVPPSILKTMTGRKGKDAWTVLGGRVYNITPYKDYHPGGGPELMRSAGRDGTKMFAEVHPWVNWEGMLEGCLIGMAVEEPDVKLNSQAVTGDGMEDMD